MEQPSSLPASTNFITDYLLFNSGNECPLNYHRWTALSLLATALCKRVWIDQGYFNIYPNLYITLVGDQGNRKSVAKDIGRDMFVEAFPDYPLGAAIQSMQDIVKTLASDDAERSYTDHTGALVTHKPMAFFINELKNWMSVDTQRMVDFLTDIYDRRVFDAGTIRHGLQLIVNPCVNILGCETPEWIIDKLKGRILTGGFARRMIYVYETEEITKIPFPIVSAEAKAARLRCVSHLQQVFSIRGPVSWEANARLWFAKWYKGMKTPDDPIMRGYYSSKHTQLLKVAMALIAANPIGTPLVLTQPILEEGLALLDLIEENMPKLSIAAGRNELAVPSQRWVEFLQKKGGAVPQKVFMNEGARDFAPLESSTVFRSLQDLGRILVKQKIDGFPAGDGVVMTPEWWAKYCKKQQEGKEEKEKTNNSNNGSPTKT